MNTLQRSTVNNAAADALRKKMQQLRDELEQVKDDLERARKELDKERHGREVVRSRASREAQRHLSLSLVVGGSRCQSVDAQTSFIRRATRTNRRTSGADNEQTR